MVAAVSETTTTTTTTTNQTTTTTTKTPLLLPSQKDNKSIRPKSRQISSRYLSPSPSSSSNSNSIPISKPNSSSLHTLTPSRRSPSPLVSRNSITPTTSKRSVSADRRRPTRPDLALKPNNAGEVSAATKLLVTSTRSLSVSFQGEAFSLPISKTKVTTPSPNSTSVIRKCTPERKRPPTPLKGNLNSPRGDHVENTKPADHHRWPARIRQANVTSLSKSLSLDCGVEKTNNMNSSGNVIRALHQSMMNLDTRRGSVDGGSRSSLDLLNTHRENPDGNSVKDSYMNTHRENPDGNSVKDSYMNTNRENPDGNSVKDSYMNTNRENPDGNYVKDSFMVSSDHTASDTDSVSSGSTSGIQENGGLKLNRLQNGPRGITVSAKFWQETNSRMRRLQDPGSPKLITPPKVSNSKKFLCESPLSSPRTMGSPNRARPSSPSKFMGSTPSRGMVSPRRNSVSGISSNFSEITPSVLSFAVDVRRGKVGENRIFDAHLLRLLYNRQLQWRFVNARTEDMVLKQKHGVEENLWNAWITISDLRDSVTKKRHRLQLLRQKLKLASILKAQINFLEDWAYLDKDHSISLLGAIEALKASTLRLPVGEGASADFQTMKDAISSALDVMQAMASSTHSLCLQVEEVNLMVTELAKVAAKEKALLRICKDFLSILSALKVKDSSLRTHMLQTSRVG